MPATDRTDDPAASGARVLAWLVCDGAAGGRPSDEACAAARRYLRRCAFPTTPDLVDDVVGDAVVAVCRRMRSSTPWELDNPAAYGTVVIHNVVNRMSRGDELPLDDLSGEPAPGDPGSDDSTADDLRVIIEHTAAAPWLTAATLAYVTFLMHPSAVPDHTPWPQAGAKPEQALAWPALWLAGLRDLFPADGGDARRRARARRIAEVLEHLSRAYQRYRAEQEWTDG